MDIGKFDRRITIQTKTVTENAYGEEITEWGEDITVWAAVRQRSGREAVQAEQLTAVEVVVFTIRYRSGVNTLGRVLYNGREYNIISTNEIGRRERLELITEGTNHG